MWAPTDMPDETRNAYHEWLDSYLISGIKQAEPEAFAWLIDRSRELVAGLVESGLGKLET
jgi:hypothetical protein